MISSALQVFARVGAAGALIAVACTGAQSQTAELPSECPGLLAAAEQRYAEQVYIDVVPLARECASRAAATPAEVERAYRLLALAYIKQGEQAQAHQAVASLLDEDPAYVADQRIDLPSYVAVVEAVREQRLRPPAAEFIAPPVAAPPIAAPPADAPTADAPTADAPTADAPPVAAPRAQPTRPRPPALGAPGPSTPDAEVLPGPVDVNTASPEALDRVPGIGPALAARIVAYREQNGAFQSARDLENVQGIGSRSVEQMLPYLTVGSSFAPLAAPASTAAATEDQVNVNTATAEELEALPGIGPALAGRIVEFRTSYGLFRDLNDLLLVRGIGARKLEALAPMATVR